ncbi:MAG: hypothetical protein RL733_813, partial [Actinomycetota bacterium]
MNRPIPNLGSIAAPSDFSEKFFSKYTHIALPLISDEGTLEIELSKKDLKQ